MLKKILISVFCIAVVQAISLEAASYQNQQNNRRNAQMNQIHAQRLHDDRSSIITEGRFAGLTEREADLIISRDLASQRAEAQRRGQAARSAAIQAAGTVPVLPPFGMPVGQDAAVVQQPIARELDFNS